MVEASFYDAKRGRIVPGRLRHSPRAVCENLTGTVVVGELVQHVGEEGRSFTDVPTEGRWYLACTLRRYSE